VRVALWFHHHNVFCDLICFTGGPFDRRSGSHIALFVTPGADIRSVCTEAGMYAIRARRKTVTEKDFLDAVNKVIKGYQKFSATPKYMVYN
jgi:hypothetical protein